MGATLDALHRLQVIENQVRIVREQMDSKRRSVQAHQRRIGALEQQLSEVHEQIRQAQAEADRMELDRRSHESNIARLRETLNRTKTNKEYAAVLSQLNTDKADALRIEDAVLAALARVDELKKKDAEVRTAREKEQARVSELTRSVAEVERQLSQQLRELEAQREDAAGQIPPEALALFERACEAHEGEAMAVIEQVHPKRAEFTCTGCNISVPLETINALQSRDVVLQCQTCSRILFLEVAAHVTA